LFPEDRELARLKEKANGARLSLLEELETAKEVLAYFQKFLPYAACLFENPGLVLDNVRFAAEQADKLAVSFTRGEKAAEAYAYATDELKRLYDEKPTRQEAGHDEI